MNSTQEIGEKILNKLGWIPLETVQLYKTGEIAITNDNIRVLILGPMTEEDKTLAHKVYNEFNIPIKLLGWPYHYKAMVD